MPPLERDELAKRLLVSMAQGLRDPLDRDSAAKLVTTAYLLMDEFDYVWSCDNSPDDELEIVMDPYLAERKREREHGISPTPDRELAKEAISALRYLGLAILPAAAGSTDENGGYVNSLTEAVMGMTAGLCRIAQSLPAAADVTVIAEAIEALALAIEARGNDDG